MLATTDLHVHESCMRVAVRVLHSCAFINKAIIMEKKCANFTTVFVSLILSHIIRTELNINPIGDVIFVVKVIILKRTSY